jgi:polysaccharide biosynthesis transport protein
MEYESPGINIHTYITSLMRHKIAASLIFLSILSTSILTAFLQKPTYQAEGRVLVKISSAAPAATRVGEQLGQTSVLYKDTKPLDTESEIMRSVPLVQKTIDRLKLKNYDDLSQKLTYKDFIGALTISQASSSDILKVLYSDQDPKKSAQIVNTLMSLYLENNIVVNRTEATVTRKFLEKQLPKAEFILRQTEFEVRKFKENNQVINLQDESKAAVDRITYLQQKLTDVQALALNSKAQADILSREIGLTPKQAVSLTSVSQSTAVQDVLLQLQPAERELAVARTNLNSEHPTIKNLEEKVVALKNILQNRLTQTLGNQLSSTSSNQQVGLLQQNATAQLINFRAQNIASEVEAQSLAQVLENYKRRANNLPKIEQKLSELQGKVQSSQSTYNLLLNKYQETRVAENQNIGNARIISPALTPLLPIAPRKALYAVFGIVLGAILASLTALLLEIRDKSVKTIKEAQDWFNLPILGIIPFDKILHSANANTNNLMGFTPEVFIRSFPRNSTSEACWMIISNLKNSTLEKKLKTIVVTSSVRQEGKSVVAANIAAALAESGLKVLLVDSNLRYPRQQQIWNLHNSLGLSNLISDNIEIEEIIQKIDKNLDIATSGMLPPSPAAFLNSLRITEIIDEFSNNYDMVIIDTPSLDSDSDALTLGRIADGVLCVLNIEKLDEASIELSKDILSKIKNKVLGIIVNGALLKNETYDNSNKNEFRSKTEYSQHLDKNYLESENRLN